MLLLITRQNSASSGFSGCEVRFYTRDFSRTLVGNENTSLPFETMFCQRESNIFTRATTPFVVVDQLQRLVGVSVLVR